MAAKILKYAALPAAAVGLGSFRIYSMNEKNNEELISPRELSIYSPDVATVPLVEEPPGVVQTGLGAVRTGLQPYARAVQSALTSVKVGVISVYLAGQDTYHFLRDPPPGFLPRVGVIGVSGLGGLVLARKGSRLKRIVVPLGLATAGTAVCYPTQTVAVLKITGKKMYTVSSSVASMLKSKPKEDVIMSAVSVESAVAVTSPDTESPVKALPELFPESEPSPAVSEEEVTPISKAESVELSPVDDIVSEDVVEPPSVDLTTGIASPLSEPESPSALETAPVTETPPEPLDGTVRDAESTLEPVAETVKESTPDAPVPEPAPEAAPADCVSEEEVTPISKAESVELSPVADIVSEDVVEPPSVDLTTGIASPLSEPESPSALETAPVTETPPEPLDGTVRDAESTLEPVAETVKESIPDAPAPEPTPEAAPADCVEDTALEPTPSADTNITPLEESDPEIVPETAPVSPEFEVPAPASPEFEVPAPTVVIEEATPSTTSTVEETTPPAPILPEDTTPTTVDEEPASVSPPPAEEAIPLTPPPAEEAPASSQPPVLEPATIKSRFVPDPSLLDHGQSNPEDADMYSTRS